MERMMMGAHEKEGNSYRSLLYDENDLADRVIGDHHDDVYVVWIFFLPNYWRNS